MPEKMKGFKGFDKDLKCRDLQYKIGEEVVHDGPLSLCNFGLHFCENPLDIFGYYPPASDMGTLNRYAEVEAEDIADKSDGDSKRVCKRLKLVAEVSLQSLIQFGVKFILEKVDFSNAPATNTGDRSAATNTGDRSAATNTGCGSAATNTGCGSAATNTGDQSAATNTGYQSAATNTGGGSAATNTGCHSAATNTGDRSAATNTGYQSAATNTGQEGCAISLGIEGTAQGEVGCWLTLAEWKESKSEWHRVDVQTVKVDGKKIKANTPYRLSGGKFVEVA